MRRTTKLKLFLLILFGSIGVSNSLNLNEKVTEKCLQNCHQTMIQRDFETVAHQCNSTCKLKQCSDGCSIWTKTSNNSCTSVCNDLQQNVTNNGVIFCSKGCSMAVAFFQNEITICSSISGLAVSFSVSDLLVNCSHRHNLQGVSVHCVLDYLSNATLPTLKVKNKSSNSVVLQWSSSPTSILQYSQLRPIYLLQKYIVGYSDDWQYHYSVNWQSKQRFKILRLDPYVTYKFRVLIIMFNVVVVQLPESHPISTEVSGVPLDVPEIVSLTTTPTSIHVKLKPPFLICAPLVGYKLTITTRQSKKEMPRVKEILSQSRWAVSEVITMLQPNTEYQISITAVNRYGSGPAVNCTAKTEKPNPENGMNSFLLIGVDNQILKQDLSDVAMEPEILYEDLNISVLITDIAVHFGKQLIFASTSNNQIVVINMKNGSHVGFNISMPASHLTVDWLNDILYRVDTNKILKCHLNNLSRCQIAVDGLNGPVEDIHIDPCNGYLYWTEQSDLYRLDLEMLKQNSSLHKNSAENLVSQNVHSFVIDYLTYRLFHPNGENNTMLSRYLDGSDLFDIRMNTQNGDFSDVLSLAYRRTNNSFIWTNGKNLIMEEFDPDHRLYHHNELSVHGNHISSVCLWDSLSQPMPVPILPPRRVQAWMLNDSAVISWTVPDSDQGIGAWKRWLYYVEVIEIKKGNPRHVLLRSTEDFSIKIDNLIPGSLYTFRVRGYSTGGQGPWSENVSAKTLLAVPTVILASDSAIYREDWTTIEIWQHNGSKIRDLHMLDNDHAIFVDENGFTYLKFCCDPLCQYKGNIGLVAFDHSTNTIYWTNDGSNVIQRMPLNRTVESESLVYSSGVILSLLLDVEQGYIYWATSHTIEMSHLDGQHHRNLHTIPRFSELNFVGLAMDLESRILYWFLKDSENLTLHRSSLRRLESNVVSKANNTMTRVCQLSSDHATISTTLEFYNNKLFWMEKPRVFHALDLETYNVSEFLLTNDTQITAFTILHSRNQTNNLPGSTIPGPVDINRLAISTKTGSLNISWSNVVLRRSDIRVYYRVSIESTSKTKEETVFTTFLIVRDVEPHLLVNLALAACSYWGCSEKKSTSFYMPITERSVYDPKNDGMISLLSVILVMTAFGVCLLAYFCYRLKDNKTVLDVNDVLINNASHELVTLDALPVSTMQMPNMLYSYANSLVSKYEDFALLPHFHRSQLRLTKLLGSGAFGKVFEGYAMSISDENPGETKVAVKTLHRNANEIEKKEFLKEALLMSKFKHDHLLRLYGICLDDDLQFLIMELMEEGDLLTFLRKSRTSQHPRLTISRLISICSDVAKGCEYLEDMHFVHRDLAARNCLVSYVGDNEVVVKICDFGLARDIYINDCYKKEGEGLLPVRWMSPESLIDGVFTTQSDIWAFGVLMWEVFTLGQQPYPAHTNLEVLHYVRNGGLLDCPDNCPDDIYNLLLKCWIFVPDCRPSFHYIVQQLKSCFSSAIQWQREGAYYGLDASDENRVKSEHSKPSDGSVESSTSSDGPVGATAAAAMQTMSPLPNPTSGSRFEACGYLEPLLLNNYRPKYLELLDMSTQI